MEKTFAQKRKSLFVTSMDENHCKGKQQHFFAASNKHHKQPYAAAADGPFLFIQGFLFTFNCNNHGPTMPTISSSAKSAGGSHRTVLARLGLLNSSSIMVQ
jgi:hypothetical protein